MSTENFNHEDQELNKVIEILSPRFCRSADIAFKQPKRNFKKIFLAFSGIAAMLAIVLTISFKSIFTVSATDLVNSALDNLFSAENIKIEFEILGSKTKHDEIYRCHSNGDKIMGTLYIKNVNGKVFNRVDWHDNENNSIIYTGTDYIHLKNGNVVGKHPSSFDKELLILLNLDNLRNDMPKDAELSKIESENVIEVKMHDKEKNITFSGEFLRKNKQLVKASVVHQGDTLLKTKSIETDIEIPQNIFIEK
ncbi:MAG: hypothetical protein K2K27_03135 [Muribaculaceae bacterium]|nr:hypothetical protein [Muribaculaceae bacterium]